MKETVLVTGGASFIGSHLVDKLVQLGARVIVLDDLSSGELRNLDESIDNIEFIHADLRDSSTDKYFRGVDRVYHLANIHGGRGFIETHPAEICQNLVIDGNVFRSCSHHGIGHVTYASSACVYPVNLQDSNNPEFARFLSESMANPFKEGCALADGVYGWAKLMGEMALKSYSEQYGLRGVSCRLFTVYGPRENESHAIIAFIIKALLKQDPYEIWGSGTQDRNFTYVSDVVDGLILASMRITDARSINIGTDEITKVIDAAMAVLKLTDFKPNEIFFNKAKPEGVNARAASITSQLETLGWRPETSFTDGIAETIKWYRENRSNRVGVEDLERLLMERK